MRLIILQILKRISDKKKNCYFQNSYRFDPASCFKVLSIVKISLSLTRLLPLSNFLYLVLVSSSHHLYSTSSIICTSQLCISLSIQFFPPVIISSKNETISMCSDHSNSLFHYFVPYFFTGIYLIISHHSALNIQYFLTGPVPQKL